MKKKTKIVLLGVLIFALLVASGLGIMFVLKKTPSGSGNVLDVAWYDEDGTEFTIDTADELYELAALSKHYNFKGQTIKLGADIVVNEGNAEDWELKNPERLWEPINGFAGTFDGQGHTISGICGKAYRYAVIDKELVYYPTGMFTNTQAKCVIKDFRLVNSYFCSDLNEGVGSVASNGGGTFDSIYSNAIIVSYKSNNGGIVGMLDAKGSHKVTNCWFDGEIRVEGNVGRYNGGIVGRVLETGGQSKIEHCLNTGKLSSTITGKGVNMGGILGNVAPKARANLKDCLAVGSVENEYAIAVGSVLGCVEGEATLNIEDCYGSADSFKTAIGNVLGTSHGAALRFSRAMLTGVSGYQWTSLDFEEYWTVVEDSTPILQYFADEIPSLKGVEKKYNLDWYNRSKKEFVLMDAKDLYGFAMMSYSTDFEDKTIKLGADIVVNEGNAKDWAVNAPEYEWLQIGQVNLPFAGTFDGDMHSISGIYLSAKENCSGLFSTTANTATLKNFKLTNSYFESDALNFASIVGRGRGTFDTIYSDAIVVSSKANLGGFIGQIPSDYGVTMTNCWFNGSVTATGNATSDRRTGGLIGFALANTTLNNCLNTGVVDASAYCAPNSASSKVIAPLVGGLAGSVAVDKVLTFNNCLNTGEIKYSKVATAGYGAVIGWSQGTAVMNQTYATSESCIYPAGGILKGQVVSVDENDIKGYKAYQWTVLDFDKYWAVVKSGTPILKSFATDIPSLAGIKRMIDISWYNADKKVYTLNSKEDLHGLALLSYSTDFAKKTIKLTADINVNAGNAADWATKAPEYKWTPIGTSSQPFAGTFDGGMHTISGLYLKADENYGGLFGSTASTATIKNVKLTNSYMETSAQSFGSIAGRGRGTFDTIYSNAIVVGSTCNLAGFIGQVPADGGVTMNNCWFDGSVTSKGNSLSDRRTGGLIGFILSDSSLNNCLNAGTVDVTAYTCPNTGGKKVVVPMAGGFVGSVSKTYTLQIKNCLNVGQIKTSEAATAGYGSIIGWSDGTTVISETHASVESCDLHANGTYKGQVGVVTKENLVGYRAYQWTLLDFDKSWAIVKESTPIPQPFATEILSLAGVQKMLDISWINETQGTKSDPYILSDAADLYGLAMLSSDTAYNGFKDKYIKLTNDIVVNRGTGNAGDWSTNVPEYSWNPIGSKAIPFAGTFDGDMHTISGLYLDTVNELGGLFAATANTATVKNLKLTNSYFTSESYGLGSIAGRGEGIFDTVYSDAIVDGSNAYVGGLVGFTYGKDGTMKKCWFAGSVTNSANHKDLRGTGGLVGCVYEDSDLQMEGCLNTGTVDVTSYDFNQSSSKTIIIPIAGGLVGWIQTKTSAVTMEDCLSTKDILVSESATGGYGAIVGYSENVKETLVSTTYTTAASTSQDMVTGKVFQMSEDELKGVEGYKWTLLNFDEYWAVVADDEGTQVDESGTPIIKAFASKVPNLKDINKMLDISWLDKADGSESNPYIISDKEDLYGLSALTVERQYNGFDGKYIQLNQNIIINSGDAQEWGEEAPKYNWKPIGEKTYPFKGNFNGDMYTISGIYLNSSAENAGLFGVTDAKSVIQQLKIENSYITSDSYGLGSVVGQARGELSKIFSNAIVVGSKSYIGGLIGYGYGEDILLKECWYEGAVINTADSSANRGTGGLIGSLYSNASACIEDCLYAGIVDATASKQEITKAGGLVGSCESGSTLQITDALNAGAVDVAYGKFDGLIVGCINGAKVRCTTSYGYGVKGEDFIAGYVQSGGEFIIDYIYNGVLTENDNRSKNQSTTNKENRYRNIPIMFINRNNPATYAYKAAESTLAGFDYDNTWTLVPYGTPVLTCFADRVINTEWPGDAKGNEEDPYTIADVKDLYAFVILSQKDTFNNKTIKLVDDIVLNTGNAKDWVGDTPEYVWTPIGKFAGIFNGNNHTISGLYMNATASNSGMFAETLASSTICNLYLKNSYLKSSQTGLGSIVGAGRGTLSKVYSDAIVDGAKQRIGGLIGGAFDKSNVLSECWFAGTVTNTGTTSNDRGTGGLIGMLYGSAKAEISDCLNTGIIDATATNQTVPKIGGIVGSVESKVVLTITDCLNAGDVRVAAGKWDGVIIGCIDGADVRCTTSYGFGVAGTDYIVGWMQNSGKFIIDYYHAGKLYENVDRSANSASSTSVNNSHRKIPIMFLDRNNPTSYTWNSATTALAQFDFDNKWSAVPSGVAVPKHFEKEVLDTSWYQEAKGTEEDPYVLSDLADLYGFASLSKTNTFEGKTVQLANDIAINKGNVDAEDWANNAPIYIWSPISEFAGTFDGNGKNVSGLYINSTSNNTGFFARTAATSTVKNLWITNSYIKSTAKRVGSVAGISLGTFDTIYSNAIIDVEKDNVGGIGGYVHEGTDTLFKNCWFNGQINGKAQNAYYFGGILGNIETETEAIVTMENCLNTGMITSIRTKAAVLGGLCGSAYSIGAKLIVKDSLFTGYFDCANMDTLATVVGYVPKGTVELTDVYSVSGTIPAIGVNGAENNGTVKGEATMVARDNLKGDKAQTNASGLDYQNIWLAAEGKTPILQAFKNYASEGVTGMLLGNSISKYRIVIDANASTLTKMLASYFQDMIKSETGATLPIVTDANAATGYEIVMGDTTRAISDLLYTDGEYTNTNYGYVIKNSDKSVVIGYSDATALVAAWKKFVVLLNEDTINGIDVTGTDERVTNVTKANSSDIRVMSSNIYFKDATDFDELGMPWEARAEIMAQVYKVYKPDFIGLQEADAKQHSEILKYIDDLYGIVTFDEASKNMTPLLYRKDLYDVVDKYYHDFGSNRHFEWALYSSKTNPDEKFIHMNLHYSPNKNEQNEHAVFVNLQIKRVMELYPNVPIAVTGDYNNSALSDTYKTMTEGINMASGAALVGNKDSEYYTCHSLGQEKLTTSSSDGTVGPIDIISITTDLLEAKNYKMNHLPITCWGSDHYPVFLDVSRK